MGNNRFGCPECGGEMIVELNDVVAEYPVTSWSEEGEPASYGEAEVWWDSAETFEVDTYKCEDCRHHFEKPVLLAEPVEQKGVGRES